MTNIQIAVNGTKNPELESELPHVSTRNKETEVKRKKTKKLKNQIDEKLATARLDLMFLLIFPFFFLIFNLIYWTSFLYVIPEEFW